MLRSKKHNSSVTKRGAVIYVMQSDVQLLDFSPCEINVKQEMILLLSQEIITIMLRTGFVHFSNMRNSCGCNKEVR